MSQGDRVLAALVKTLGLVVLGYALITGIAAPGAGVVNLSLMHANLVAHIWGFGLLIVGMLMARPAGHDLKAPEETKGPPPRRDYPPQF